MKIEIEFEPAAPVFMYHAVTVVTGEFPKSFPLLRTVFSSLVVEVDANIRNPGPVDTL